MDSKPTAARKTSLPPERQDEVDGGAAHLAASICRSQKDAMNVGVQYGRWGARFKIRSSGGLILNGLNISTCQFLRKFQAVSSMIPEVGTSGIPGYSGPTTHHEDRSR